MWTVLLFFYTVESCLRMANPDFPANTLLLPYIDPTGSTVDPSIPVGTTIVPEEVTTTIVGEIVTTTGAGEVTTTTREGEGTTTTTSEGGEETTTTTELTTTTTTTASTTTSTTTASTTIAETTTTTTIPATTTTTVSTTTTESTTTTIPDTTTTTVTTTTTTPTTTTTTTTVMPSCTTCPDLTVGNCPPILFCFPPVQIVYQTVNGCRTVAQIQCPHVTDILYLTGTPSGIPVILPATASGTFLTPITCNPNGRWIISIGLPIIMTPFTNAVCTNALPDPLG